MYYRIGLEINPVEAYVDEIKISENQTDRLIDGLTIDSNEQIEISVINRDRYLPDMMGDNIIRLIINSKIKHILECYESKSNLQFIPVLGSSEPRWLANILNNLEAFDWEKSIYTTFSNPKALRKVTRLFLKEDKIGNRHIFKLKEKPVGIFISETLKKALEAEGVTGIVISDNMDLSVGI